MSFDLLEATYGLCASAMGSRLQSSSCQGPFVLRKESGEPPSRPEWQTGGAAMESTFLGTKRSKLDCAELSIMWL
eukprot:634433-Amphidinium_carterae.1